MEGSAAAAFPSFLCPEQPVAGRRGPRSREEGAPVAGGGFGCGAEDGRNMEMAGRGLCAEDRDAGADGRELRGTRGRPLLGGERPAYREETSRAGSRDAGVADRCRTVPGSGRRLAMPRRENRPEGARRLFPMSAEWGQKGGFSASSLEIRPKRLPLPPQTVPSRCGRRD